MPQLKGKDDSTGIIKTNNKQKQLHAFYKCAVKHELQNGWKKDGEHACRKLRFLLLILEKV